MAAAVQRRTGLKKELGQNRIALTIGPGDPSGASAANDFTIRSIAPMRNGGPVTKTKNFEPVQTVFRRVLAFDFASDRRCSLLVAGCDDFRLAFLVPGEFEAGGVGVAVRRQHKVGTAFRGE